MSLQNIGFAKTMAKTITALNTSTDFILIKTSFAVGK